MSESQPKTGSPAPQQDDTARHPGKSGQVVQPLTSGILRRLHEAAFREDVLGDRTKELIAFATAVSANCGACIAYHTREAMKAGAVWEEILETFKIARLMSGAHPEDPSMNAIEGRQRSAGERPLSHVP